MNKKQRLLGWFALATFAFCAFTGASSTYDREFLGYAAIVAVVYVGVFFLLKDYPGKPPNVP
jgi:hypothetical protein